MCQCQIYVIPKCKMKKSTKIHPSANKNPYSRILYFALPINIPRKWLNMGYYICPIK